MKKLFGLIVILVVLVLGGYFGTGLITERALKKDLAVINQSNGLHVDIAQYHRGWFESTVELNWTLHVPERVIKNQDGQTSVVPAQDYSINMPLTIYHGPIIFKNGVHFDLAYAQTDLTLPQQLDKQFEDTFTSESSKPKLAMSLMVDYMRKSHFQINLPEFNVITKEGGAKFDWQGMKSSVVATESLDHISGDTAVDGFQLAKDDAKLMVGKIDSHYDLTQSKEGLYVGQAGFALQSISATAKDQPIFNLSNFQVETKSSIKDELFNTELQSSVDKIEVNSKAYGPGKLSMSLNNLDARVLAKINEEAGNIQNDTAQQKQQALLMLLPELPKLLSKGAEFNISEMSIVVPEGTIDGRLSISLASGEMKNPFELIQRIKGDGKLSLPETIVQHLMTESAKQQLSSQQPANLQQAIASQMAQTVSNEQPQSESSAPNVAKESAGDQSTETLTQAASDTEEKVETSQNASSTNTTDDLDAKAKAQADGKLSELVQSGALVKQGDSYSIEIKLVDGQLSVNGQPFTQSMLKF